MRGFMEKPAISRASAFGSASSQAVIRWPQASVTSIFPIRAGANSETSGASSSGSRSALKTQPVGKSAWRLHSAHLTEKRWRKARASESLENHVEIQRISARNLCNRHPRHSRLMANRTLLFFWPNPLLSTTKRAPHRVRYPRGHHRHLFRPGMAAPPDAYVRVADNEDVQRLNMSVCHPIGADFEPC